MIITRFGENTQKRAKIGGVFLVVFSDFWAFNQLPSV